MSNIDSLAGSGDNEKSSKDSSQGETAQTTSIPVVSAETEKRLLKKLDRRIIPICCWIYLMNFMDRGEQSRSILTLKLNWNRR